MDSSSFSLVLIDGEKKEISLIFPHDILTIRPMNQPIVVDDQMPFNASSSSSVSTDEMSAIDRYEKIRSYLKSKRIPFEEEKTDEKRILIHRGIVQIAFPFKRENLFGTNEIVRRKMQHLRRPIID